MTDKRPLLVQLPITVKTYDVDFASIVHNMVYIRWLEDLRTAVLDAVYPIAEMLADGITPILTRTEIDYRSPLRLGDVAQGRMWGRALERTRWTLAGEIVIGERVAVTAVQTGYFAGLETMRPVRVPARLRRAWEA